MKLIATDTAPAPAGHYSQAVVHNDLVFVSGMLAVDPKTGQRKLDSITDESEQVLANLAAVLHAAGSSMDNVLKVTVYVSDIAHWAAFNTVYARHFGTHKPARAVVPCGPLHHGHKVEVECVATTKGEAD